MITESSHQLCLAKVCIICIKQKINHSFFRLVLKFVQFLQISFKNKKNREHKTVHPDLLIIYKERITLSSQPSRDSTLRQTLRQAYRQRRRDKHRHRSYNRTP